MRQLIDILVATMIAALLTGGVLWHRAAEQREADIAEVRASVGRFQGQLHLLRALLDEDDDVARSAIGYPLVLEPAWFERGLPRNPLLDDGRPWLEIAGGRDAHRLHPAEPTVGDSDRMLAAFWYNPHQGVVRARVPRTSFEAHDAILYSFVNRLIDELPEASSVMP